MASGRILRGHSDTTVPRNIGGCPLSGTEKNWGIRDLTQRVQRNRIYPVNVVLFLQPTEQQALGFDRQILMPSCYYTKIAV